MMRLFQLLAQLKRSNFTLLNQRVNFNDNGDPRFGSYAVSFWNQSGDAQEFGICSFYPSIHIFINESKIQWHSSDVSRVFPLSRYVCMPWEMGTVTAGGWIAWCLRMKLRLSDTCWLWDSSLLRFETSSTGACFPVFQGM